ncbi:cytochrome P450 [Artomyces pyxidatus]|uniref:Cytochrome P450 n=1 Tax=Artomyces pyxidatus TaxID=48021 RepID=A0ACB8SR29_9AGAM|nr:cytochrome P450 [Artomyces pyxidatus]
MLLVAVIASAAFLCWVAYYAVERRRRRKGLSYPPGPPPRPIIGNLLDVPTVDAWATYAGWEKKYGDIMSLHVLGNVIIVLQSVKATRDLLEKRASIYSDRPVLPFFDMMDSDWSIPLARYTDYWRRGRHILERGLRPTTVALYQPIQKAKTHTFLKKLLTHPEDYREHIEHLQGAILMGITYGYDVKERDDHMLEKARELVNLAAATVMPGALLVNDLPFLQYLPEWLPGMGFKALARNGRALGEAVIYRPFSFVKSAIENGTAGLSLAREVLEENPSQDPVVEDRIATAIGSLYAAGSDATVAAVLSFFLMLVQYPAVQEKAQAELDAITGGSRLPDFTDRARLPYINAVCMELLRWRMVAPLGMPHAATEDDVYDGYFIPKGAIVLANAWAILHDPAVYPDPDTFNPDRFLTPEGELKDDPFVSMAFGFGKRTCPARFLVDRTLFIEVTYVLATFDVRKARDANGNEISVDPAYVGMQTSQPEPFACSIVPRSKTAEGLILAD